MVRASEHRIRDPEQVSGTGGSKPPAVPCTDRHAVIWRPTAGTNPNETAATRRRVTHDQQRR